MGFFLKNIHIPVNATTPVPRSAISTLKKGFSGKKSRIIRIPNATAQEMVNSFIIDFASKTLLKSSQSRKKPVKSDIRKRWILSITNSLP